MKIENEIFTVFDKNIPNSKFSMGVSYCYPRKIIEPELSKPIKGFINYHPAPLPKYRGPNELENAIRNRETDWGVTVHKMDQNYDTGDIIKIKRIKLHEPPISQQELGAVSHYFLFELFKETISLIFDGKYESYKQ